MNPFVTLFAAVHNKIPSKKKSMVAFIFESSISVIATLSSNKSSECCWTWCASATEQILDDGSPDSCRLIKLHSYRLLCLKPCHTKCPSFDPGCEESQFINVG